MAIERGPQWAQLPLLPGHEPGPVLGTASAWAATVAGPGAEVRYAAPEKKEHIVGEHLLSVHVPDRRDPVGHLDWDERQGVVNGVYVDPAYRRRGIARGLWGIAKTFGTEHPDTIPPVRHSPVQLPAGKVWAKAVGD